MKFPFFFFPSINQNPENCVNFCIFSKIKGTKFFFFNSEKDTDKEVRFCILQSMRRTIPRSWVGRSRCRGRRWGEPRDCQPTGGRGLPGRGVPWRRSTSRSPSRAAQDRRHPTLHWRDPRTCGRYRTRTSLTRGTPANRGLAAAVATTWWAPHVTRTVTHH